MFLGCDIVFLFNGVTPKSIFFAGLLTLFDWGAWIEGLFLLLVFFLMLSESSHILFLKHTIKGCLMTEFLGCSKLFQELLYSFPQILLSFPRINCQPFQMIEMDQVSPWHVKSKRRKNDHKVTNKCSLDSGWEKIFSEFGLVVDCWRKSWNSGISEDGCGSLNKVSHQYVLFRFFYQDASKDKVKM